MSDSRKQVDRLSSSKPIGVIEPVSNRYGRDDAGRIFSYMPIEQLNAIQKSKQIGKDTRHFSFTNMQNIREITDGLSNKYCGYILMLQPYIQFNTNILVGRDNVPLIESDFVKVFGASKRTVKTILTELEMRSIIFEDSGSYSINERYHFRKKAGKEAEVLVKTFFTTLKGVKLTPAELGFVYKLLPNVHYDTNIICSDPFAVNPNEIEFLNEKQIADLIGMSVSKTKEVLTKLRKAGVIGEWLSQDDKRETLTVLNPYIFYRKEGKPDKTLQALFSSRQFRG